MVRSEGAIKMKCAICGSENVVAVRRIFIHPEGAAIGEHIWILICAAHIMARNENLAKFVEGKKLE